MPSRREYVCEGRWSVAEDMEVDDMEGEAAGGEEEDLEEEDEGEGGVVA